MKMIEILDGAYADELALPDHVRTFEGYLIECNSNDETAIYQALDEFRAAFYVWPAVYVNVYWIDLAYGGPEEGGWWFDYGQILSSHRVDTYEEAIRLKEKLQNGEYTNEGRRPISSVLSNGEYAVYIERHKGKDFPDEQPRYE